MLSGNATPKASARIRHGSLTNERGDKRVSTAGLDPSKQVTARSHERELPCSALRKLLSCQAPSVQNCHEGAYDWISVHLMAANPTRPTTTGVCKQTSDKPSSHLAEMALPFQIAKAINSYSESGGYRLRFTFCFWSEAIVSFACFSVKKVIIGRSSPARSSATNVNPCISGVRP